MSAAADSSIWLAANAVGAWLIGLALAWAAIGVFRVRTGAARVALLSIPFLKVGWELVASLLTGPGCANGHLVADFRTLQIGLGVTAPLAVRVQVVMQSVAAGGPYPFSFGDAVVRASSLLGPWCASALAASLCAVSLTLVARRLVVWIRFFREHARHCSYAHLLESQRIGWLRVPVLVVDTTAPAPFTTGLLKPVVCLPQWLDRDLEPAQRHAIVAHELGHVRAGHLPLLMSLHIATDVFWFLPGSRWLARAVADACERAADDDAIRNGVDPSLLASTLVVASTLRAKLPRRPDTLPVPAMAAAGRSLSRRVARLLAAAPAPEATRWRWARLLLRVAVVIATTHSALVSVVGGG